MNKVVICRDCEVPFEIPVQRGRPAVRCEPCRSKTPTVMSFAKLEVLDGVTWIENSEACEGCNRVFMRIRKKGRPPKKCPECSTWEITEKDATRTTSQETLDELFSGDKNLLLGTPGSLPKGNEAQCPTNKWSKDQINCGRIFTSDSRCEEHKIYQPKGFTCKDPVTLGMIPITRRGLPIWTRPKVIKEV